MNKFQATFAVEVVPYKRLPHSKMAQRLNKDSRRYFDCRDAIAILMKNKKNRDGVKQFTTPVAVTLQFFIANNRRSDMDNLEKTVLDSIVKAGVIKDDYLVEQKRTSLRRGSRVHILDILVEPLTPPPA